MTVLVAQHLKDKIILTADRAVFRGYLKVRSENKIIQINEITFAGTGRTAISKYLEMYCQNKRPENNDGVSVLRFFAEFQEFLDKYKTNLRYDENNFFFVYKQTLFQVGDGVREIKEGNYDTLGAGTNEAAMCMHLGLTPKEAVLKTIEMNVWTANGCQEVIIDKQK
jgi:hypothetical protein